MPNTARSTLSSTERSAIGRASWKDRQPTYRPQKCITVRADVYDKLDEARADLSWSAYLCNLAGIPPPPDRRRRAK